jgi:hypothetical protein
VGLWTHRPLPRDEWPAGLGRAWAELLEDFECKLHALDPRCFVWRVDLECSLRVSIDSLPEVEDRARALVAELERQAAMMCETCGGPGALRAGVFPQTRCDDCMR